MADFVKISDSLESPSSNTAASTIALSSIAESILDAAKNVTEGSDNSTDLREPLLADVYHEIGTWWISLDNSIPVGGLPHLGHLCSRATYGDFWTWCELNKTVVSDEDWLAYAESHNGCCPYYSYGDGSTTFRTPKYDQSFLKVLATIGGTGEMQEAGLPNITGTADMQGSTVTSGDGNFGYTTGVFSVTARGLHGSGNSASSTYINSIDFDASRSNPIYGNSDTVTPQNFGVIVGVYAVGAVSAPIGETDAANLLNGISVLESNMGAMQSGSGFTEEGKAEIVGWGMPDYTAKVTFSFIRGTEYTAPFDGYFNLFTFVLESGEGQEITVNSIRVQLWGAGSSGIRMATGFIPVKKGDVVIGTKEGDGTWYPRKGA